MLKVSKRLQGRLHKEEETDQHGYRVPGETEDKLAVHDGKDQFLERRKMDKGDRIAVERLTAHFHLL